MKMILPTLFCFLVLLPGCKNDSVPANPPHPAPASEVAEDNIIQLSSGPLSLSVDLQMGGRVSSFAYEGKEILKVSRDSNNWQWGSTVWPSPQADWGWPPPPVFDSEPFKVSRSEDNHVTLLSEVDSVSLLQMTKTYRLAEDEQWGHIATMIYRIYNRSEERRKVAVWENTRVPFSGSITFPRGGELRLSDPKRQIVMVPRAEDNVIFLSDEQPNRQKIFYDPAATDERYISHTYQRDGLVFRKNWKPPGNVPPEQAKLEIYLAPNEGFAELEIQGQYINVAPGDHVDLSVIWQLFPDK